jgi:PKD repeat protein
VTVTLSYNNTYQQVQSAISNGAFNITFNVCKNLPVAAAVYVYDSVTNLTSNAYPILIDSLNKHIGQINDCGNTSISPVADFTYSIGNTSPVTVTFNNTSTNSTSWSWVFGDGYSSLQQNPTHVYTTYGNLLVTLTATGPGGSNTISKVLTISGTADSSYINLTMNGATYTWAYPDISAYHADTSGGNRTYIYASSASSPFNHINFEVLNDNASPGNYNITLSANINGKSYPNNNATTIVTEYGSPGGNIIGTSSGQLFDSTTNIPFTLAYKVKRDR